ncbi:hypothetical protein PAXRUDRAFT_174858, partial [Paxillus rubicundulus Ve08.2h10]
ALKVVVPGAECFMDGKEFFVMGVIVELQSSKGPGVECNWVKLNWSRGEGVFQALESGVAFIGEVPWSIFPGEAGEQNNDVRIIENEVVVEVGGTEEGLHVFDFLRFWLISDSSDIVGGHSQAAREEEVSKVFDRGGMCNLWFNVYEYLMDMVFVRGHVLGIDEDVVQIDYNANIEHISDNGVDEPLESH